MKNPPVFAVVVNLQTKRIRGVWMKVSKLTLLLPLIIVACNNGPSSIVVTTEQDPPIVTNNDPIPPVQVNGDPIDASGQSLPKMGQDLKTIGGRPYLVITGTSVTLLQNANKQVVNVGAINGSTCTNGKLLAINSVTQICIASLEVKTYSNASGIRFSVNNEFLPLHAFARRQLADHPIGVNPRETAFIGNIYNLVAPVGRLLPVPMIVSPGKPYTANNPAVPKCSTNVPHPWVPNAVINTEPIFISNGPVNLQAAAGLQAVSMGGCVEKAAPNSARIVEVVEIATPSGTRVAANPYLFASISTSRINPGAPVEVQGQHTAFFEGDKGAVKIQYNPNVKQNVIACDTAKGYIQVLLGLRVVDEVIACALPRFLLAGKT